MSDLSPPLSSLNTLSNLTDQRLPIDSIRLQTSISGLVSKRNWNQAEKLSSQARGTVLSALNVSEGEYRKRVRVEKLRDGTYDRMVGTGNEMKIALEDANFRKKLKDAGILKKFQRVAKNMKFARRGPQDELPFKIISERSQYFIAMGYTGYWGSFHASFNQHLKKFVPKPLSLIEIKNLKKVIKTEQSIISNNLFKLYSVIKRGKRDDLSYTSWHILRSQEANLYWFSTLCASICALTQAILNGQVDGDPKKMGQLDLLAGKLARSWILLTVWALYVAHLSLLPEGDVTFQEMVKTAKTLPFRSKREKAKVVSPKTLSVDGQNFDGKYVQINGFVKDMTTKRTQDGKFLNVFEVYEPGSEEEAVRVAVIFEHMGHRGLVNTSYVELYGTWKETSPLADTPVLQLERLKISELEKRFGFDFMLDRLRPWFDYFPNSYHAFWSVRPQRKTGGGGPKGLLTGAGELMVIHPFTLQPRNS